MSSKKTKKVRIGGFFGNEVEISENIEADHKNESKSLNIIINEKAREIQKADVSIQKRKNKYSIKICRICGTTVKTTSCPNCKAKVI